MIPDLESAYISIQREFDSPRGSRDESTKDKEKGIKKGKKRRKKEDRKGNDRENKRRKKEEVNK